MYLYYKHYYDEQLGLADWEDRVNLRKDEEKIYCSRFINWIEDWIDYNFSNKKVLVVGSGTGGELVVFHKKGSDVYGIEPNKKAIEISRLKAEINQIPQEKIIKAYSENLPFQDASFDFIYCFTVLEHVQDVEKTISEIVRCLKISGKAFIEAPDYRQLFEGHYKLPIPMFLPKWFNRIILLGFRRPSAFLNSINKINAKKIKRILLSHPVTPIRIYKNNLKSINPPKSLLGKLIIKIQKFIRNTLGIHLNQIWIIHKNRN